MPGQVCSPPDRSASSLWVGREVFVGEGGSYWAWGCCLRIPWKNALLMPEASVFKYSRA